MSLQRCTFSKPALLSLLAFTSTCTAPAGQKPVPASPSPSSAATRDSQTVPSPSTSRIYRFRITPGIQHYLVVSDAKVVLNDDSTRESFVSTRAYYTLAIDPSGQVQRGTVDSLTIRRQSTIPAPPDSNVVLPISWTSNDQPSGCSYNQRLIELGKGIIPTLPTELKPGSSWQDTTSITLCILSSAVAATITTQYSVIGPSTFRADSTFLITRTSRLDLAADTTRMLSQMPHVEATGLIKSDIHLDIVRGQLLTRTDDGRLEIRLGTGPRSTKLRQDLRGQVAPIRSP